MAKTQLMACRCRQQQCVWCRCGARTVFTGVIDDFIPALVLPGSVPRVLSGLQVLVRWNKQTKEMIVGCFPNSDTGYDGITITTKRSIRAYVNILTPKMMDHIEVSYLREEAADCLVVVLPVADSSRPKEQDQSSDHF